MNKQLISRISNGFGNQMFLYAASYAFAKKNNYDLFLDIYTGINHDIRRNKKDKFKHYEPKYELDIFNLSCKFLNKDLTFDSNYGYLKRKFSIFIDRFKKNKNFLLEKKNSQKNHFFNPIDQSFFQNKKIYIEGHFESEKYFLEYRNDILKEFNFRNIIDYNKKYYENIVSSNSISLVFRSDRFTEKYKDEYSQKKINKTKKFEDDQYSYILKSINYFNKKISNPKFFLFSDDFSKIEKKLYNQDNIIFVKDFISNKILEDFFLMLKCKNYAVGPTTFHWWAAWLNDNPDKICVRPLNLNPSNNIDFWPESWHIIK